MELQAADTVCNAINAMMAGRHDGRWIFTADVNQCFRPTFPKSRRAAGRVAAASEPGGW